MRYEGYGPAGVAVIVEALTDNRNRTASDVRTAFNKYGGALGETNSVSFMFNRLGAIRYPDISRQCRRHAGSRDRGRRRERRKRRRRRTRSLARSKISSLFATHWKPALAPPETARLEWRPTTSVTLDEDRAASVLKLLDALDENDDVQNVYANFDIPDEVAAKLSG